MVPLWIYGYIYIYGYMDIWIYAQCLRKEFCSCENGIFNIILPVAETTGRTSYLLSIVQNSSLTCSQCSHGIQHLYILIQVSVTQSQLNSVYPS